MAEEAEKEAAQKNKVAEVHESDINEAHERVQALEETVARLERALSKAHTDIEKQMQEMQQMQSENSQAGQPTEGIRKSNSNSNSNSKKKGCVVS